MKMRLTTLLFGLLLAVGWTSSAFAQSSPNNIPDAVYPKSYYDALTYTWVDAGGTSHTSAATEEATDPYQIYELLRFVYCDPRFPGPYYSAYTPRNEREDPVYYGAIEGGWDISASDVTQPNYEGYTALMVAVNNDNYKETEADAGGQFTTKAQVIEYFGKTIVSVKLLTDGLRIGSASDYSSGTVFNCDGTYNKFFILGKGQARKKAPGVSTNPTYTGEEVPFKFMFEQFSPTTGDSGAQIDDFYSKMLEGSTYKVVHDCASVLQNGHQFSMSGNTGTTAYALTGLNFFIPDYRLKFWSFTSGGRTLDGRDMNPCYTTSTTTGQHSNNYYQTPGSWAAWYAQYNQDYAPQIGIYKISLTADAEKVEDYSADNRYYTVTLHWVSSLDEMSGHPVPQTYTIYIVNEDGTRTPLSATGVTNPTGETTVTYTVPQNEHSYMIEYIIEGSPNDNDHPAFVAWSNQDHVIIPGWNDFLALGLDHYESDFVLSQEKNWYRNFLLVANENEENALTVKKIGNGEDTFNLYRYTIIPADESLTKIATLTFDNPTPEKVHYAITYEDGQEILPYNLKNSSGQVVQANAYERANMGIPDEGYVRVKGNGDIVIYPSSYDVNFKSIRVYNGETVVAQWTAPNNTSGTAPLPSGWILSPGSIWEPYTTSDNDRVYYIEGGGYIAIPNMLNNYTELRVVIRAYGDGATTATIAVNDDITRIANNTAADYEWTVTANRDNRYLVTSYKKITSTDELTDGEYLIVCENNSVAFDGGLSSLDVGHNTIDVEIDGGKIVADETTDAASFTITNTSGSDYTIRSKSGYYIGRTANSNGMNTSQTTAYNNTITFSNGNASILGYINDGWWTDTYYYLRFNSSSGNNNYRFRYYSSTQQNIQLYKKVVEDVELPEAMVRLGHLPIVDQFTESTAKNEHPERYGYILKYEPAQGETLQSGHVEVPVEHTGSVVSGYYTQDQVDGDTDGAITPNVLSADVQLNLSKTNSDITYYKIQSKKGDTPADDGDYITNLQRQTDFNYKEMLETSEFYNKIYEEAEYHYYTSTPVTGSSASDFLTYVPSISEWGLDRRYYETDHLDNTYGAPIWGTGLGQAVVSGAKLERQAGSNGAYNANVNWKDENGKECSLYILTLNIQGSLPTGDNIDVNYEPYMYRIWVVSDGLRNMDLVPGTGAVNNTEADRTSPRLIYENVTTADQITITKDASNWSNNIMFGKLNDAAATFIIRFYYRVVPEGENGLRNRDGETPMFYASEGDFEPQESTAVYELVINGEVVSTTYYNAQGMKSDKPFDGMNIVVTRYSDGTTITTKEFKY